MGVFSAVSFCSTSPLVSLKNSLFPSHRQGKATLSVESLSSSTTDRLGNVLLEVRDLSAVIAYSKQQILNGVNLTVRQGEVLAVMGKNGSGKSTFANVLVGNPDYEITGGSVSFKGDNLLEMEPEEISLPVFLWISSCVIHEF